MKLLIQPRRRQEGSAVFIFIVLLSLMTMFLAINSRTLFRLDGELRVIERRQTERSSLVQTNVVAAQIAQ